MLTWCRRAVNRVSLSCLAACRMRSSPCAALSRPCVRSVLRWSAFLHQLRRRFPGLVRWLLGYYDGVRLLTPVHHRLRLLAFPTRAGAVLRHRSDVRSPSFQRDPFGRDGVLDHGRAPAPRLAAPLMLPSTSSTVSASAGFAISWLNVPPHTIAVYASPLASLPTAQHSLPGRSLPVACAGLPPARSRQLRWRTEGRTSARPVGPSSTRVPRPIL